MRFSRVVDFRNLKLGQAGAFVAIAVVASSSVARAEEAAAEVAAGPTIDVSVPEPPAPVERTFQQHEGFYLRAAVGLGSFGASGEGDSGTGGLSLSYDLLVGMGPAPGLALGAGVIGDLQLSGEWEVNDTGTGISGDLTSLVVGPFVDGFPNPRGGWHFGGLAGLAVHSSDPSGADSQSALGFGAAAWAGHDVWVAPEWSVGGNLRLDASRTSEEGAALSRIGLSLSFSVLYN